MISDALKQLKELQVRVEKARDILSLDEKLAEIKTLEGKMNEPGFWEDKDTARDVTTKHAGLTESVKSWDQAQEDVLELITMGQLLTTESDADQAKAEGEFEKKATGLAETVKALEVQLLFSGPHDENNAIFSVKAGAGGVDAQDWAEMLLRMVTRYVDSKGWKAELVQISKGSEAGVKSATLIISGHQAYGHLKAEHGVHRLVRISPFDAEAMRHTSFASIEVIPDLGDAKNVEIKDEDIRIDLFKASGHGGQSVNTTDSAVRIVHIPTNITVSVQNERSQQQNKAKAMAILKSKLAVKAEEERRAAEAEASGEHKSAEWGNQIRSYVLHPYKIVKDHRTKHEDSNPQTVLDGDLDPFIEAYLRWKKE